jgi:hypothetical protein
MFKRQIQIDVVKKPRKNETVDHEDPVEEYNRLVYISAAVNTAIFQVAKVVAAYMVLDATRKIVVNRLSK